jgi:uncharacterized DUF497 family protein
MVTLYDRLHSTYEDRWITLGLSAAGRLLVVNHTFPQRVTDRAPCESYRQKATTHEKRQYQET